MSNWARRMHRRAATLSNVVTSCGHPNTLPYPRRLEKVKFGVPLHEVCKDDIPGPLLVLILKLNKEAPLRRDVFRAPGHQGAMKKLIHFLQTGRLVNVDNYSVYTIASVLKKFLRKIPGGVFGRDGETHLFTAVEFPEEQQVHEIRRSSLTKKERHAARQWKQKWSFYTKLREMQEEEALNLGMSLEEYRAGVLSMNCQSEPRQYPVQVDPSPAPLPITSSGMIGRRALCPLERYGRLVRTARDYPTLPPLPPGQIYDPYKQTIIFLGIDVGDPISYKLPAARCEVTDDMWARAQPVAVDPLADNLAKL